MILQVLLKGIRKACKMMNREVPAEIKIGTELALFLDKQHGLYQLADMINWDWLIENYGMYYCENNGRPSIPLRVIVGLHYIKYLEGESDESVVEKFCENPYWQYFCGFKTFQHELPCHPTTLSKWRKKVGEKAIEKMLEETLNIAKRESLLTDRQCKRLNVDTTVQEKAIAFPTDSKLYHIARMKLVDAAKARNINLRQSYERVGKKAFIKHGRYLHARQMKRAKKERKKLKTYLGRTIRDIKRKMPEADTALLNLLTMAEKIFHQEKADKNKIYSLWAPEVECIAKGKSHKKYEFGCKVSLATTCKDPWVVSIKAIHGNPYDGHTLKSTIDNAQSNSGVRAEDAFVDRGYRGKDNHPDDVNVYISGRKGLKGALKKLLRGRSGIEPVIGHVKHEHLMDRNYLHGIEGDKINAVLSGCAFNMRKILRKIEPEKHSIISYAVG